jgi:hypothetical protein
LCRGTGNARDIPEERGQDAKGGNVDVGTVQTPPAGAGRAIEHPGRNLKLPIRSPAGKAAAEDPPASSLDHLVNMNAASRPGTIGKEKLV